MRRFSKAHHEQFLQIMSHKNVQRAAFPSPTWLRMQWPICAWFREGLASHPYHIQPAVCVFPLTRVVENEVVDAHGRAVVVHPLHNGGQRLVAVHRGAAEQEAVRERPLARVLVNLPLHHRRAREKEPHIERGHSGQVPRCSTHFGACRPGDVSPVTAGT